MSQELKVGFNHGLGDCVYFAHICQLYKKRGWNVFCHYDEDKKAIFEATDIPYCEENPLSHPWWEAGDSNSPHPLVDWSGSKIFSNINQHGLPNIGKSNELWEELCNLNLQNSFDNSPTDKDVKKLLNGLPRPIIAIHSQGNTSQSEKNLPNELVENLYKQLIHRTEFGILLLDWDDRMISLNHGRIRHVKRDWCHVNLNQLAAIYKECGLLIGVDSGPLHFASLSRIPTLGVFHTQYPTCYTLPNQKAVNMTRACYRNVNRTRRKRWNIVEYKRDMPTAEEIVLQSIRILAGTKYGLPLARDIMLQQMVNDWCHGSGKMCPIADRRHTFNILLKKMGKNPIIVETGCIKAEEEWSETGNSTYIFSLLVDLGGSLFSVDNNMENTNFAINECGQFNNVCIVNQDSISFLKGFKKRIDVLYLNSPEDIMPSHAQHALEELKACMSCFHRNSLVMVNDTVFGGGWMGRGRLVVPYLLDLGWEIVGSGYQVILAPNKETMKLAISYI